MRHFIFYLSSLFILIGCTNKPIVESDPSINVKDGFIVQKLHVPNKDQGSWVSITKDDNGRLITSDQYGSLFYVDVPKIGTTDSIKVTPFPLKMGQAHGLLWAHNSLYVMKNDKDRQKSGLYRVTDSNADGELDKIEMLHQFVGNGEHGPHGIVLGPDGKLYMSGGNHTFLPKEYNSVLKPIWDEDQLLPAIKDPRGHANSVKAPGGWVARAEADGSNFTVIAMGFRNAYDLAFNPDGELFTFDSDMEWDMGSAWYRPVRICHITEGAEFGWRTGSGKWPAYYPDNLNSVIDVGQGSPTGLVAGKDLNFPGKYKDGLFVFDWSFGTMYYASLTADGSSYSGEIEEFLSGSPLPLTDGIAGDDGAMYFTIGGRRLASGLYRVYHKDNIKNEATANADNSERKLRKTLESYANGNKVDKKLLWSSLGHQDKRIAYTARVAIEHQESAWIAEQLADESSTNITIQATIALARIGSQTEKEIAFLKLLGLPAEELVEQQSVNAIRAMNLLLIRGKFTDTHKAQIRNVLGEYYPVGSNQVDRELVQLLVYADDEKVVAKTLPLLDKFKNNAKGLILNDSIIARSDQYGKTIERMKKNTPPAELMHYVKALSHAKKGWTNKLREDYFKQYATLFAANGGESYNGFLLRMRAFALENAPKTTHKNLVALSGEELIKMNRTDLSSLPKPKGPGENWAVNQITAIEGIGNKGDAVNGEKMYRAVLCASCHTVNGKGGSVGPDLTQIATRFSIKDIAEAIISPNQTISDQYEALEIKMKDEKLYWGRLISETKDTLSLNTSPLNPTQQVKLLKKDIVKKTVSDRSIMMPSLLNRLNEQEVKDLFYFLKEQAK
mgnify:CR=1 FL=1